MPEIQQYSSTEIHHARLYPNLDTLINKGLIRKGAHDDRTNAYELTERGEREINARREWEAEYVSLSE